MSEKIYYELIRSDRRTCQIQIKRDGQIVVRAPRIMPEFEICRFVEEKSDWIERTLRKIESANRELCDLPEIDIDELANMACEYIPERVEYFAPIVGVEYNNITIRNQKTRWGSCSGKGNLNFNCLLMLTPREIADYVVVHELCHLIEMNHSDSFWKEVERVLPDYKKSRAWLKNNGGAIMNRYK